MDDDRFWVKSLTLENFRCFERLELRDLDPQFNLLVGVNGAGKTSVLLALANLFRQLGKPGAGPGETMTDLADIRSVRRVGADGSLFEQAAASGKFLAVVEFGGRDWSAFEPVGSNVPYQHGTYYQPGVFGEVVRDPGRPHEYFRPGLDTQGQISDAPLPLIANYSVSRKFRRLREIGNSDARTLNSRLSALKDWREAGEDLGLLFEWTKLQTLIDLQGKALSDDGVGTAKVERGSSAIGLVSEALAAALEDVRSVEFRGVRNDIVVEFLNGHRLDFSTMSDGQRSYVGLVADIAQRVSLLNAPVLGRRALTETPGLILIDEIDLHLHPKWQRRIVGALKEIFPKIQFFATTHSPQVIGEAQPKEIVLLAKDGQQKRPHQSFGMDSNWILECVMEAEGRDPHIAKRIKSVFDLIEDDRFVEAKAEIVSLREIIDGDPEVVAAEAYIWNLEHAPDEATE